LKLKISKYNKAPHGAFFARAGITALAVAWCYHLQHVRGLTVSPSANRCSVSIFQTHLFHSHKILLTKIGNLQDIDKASTLAM